MISVDDIINEARTWIDTPFVHQARVKGVGVDCVNLPVACLESFGVNIEGMPSGYPREPDGTLERELSSRLEQIEEQPGALLVFRIRRNPQHVAIATDYGMIHSYSGGGNKVVEHGIDPWWRERLIRAYALPGVEYVIK